MWQRASVSAAGLSARCIIAIMVKLTRLKDVRQRKALTQQQLAERAGVNRVTIARIDGGKDEPFLTTVRKVADARHCDTSIRSGGCITCVAPVGGL
jgi:DNA-binding XRE family transcriptional regulator